ncbi:hypothetical protein F2Q69_00048134 [Brassica cretica]|uniref:Transmembrane protein n=1 Tax=Brassica cretica TaxID=69181 RepID=A0A8S9PWC3_BRACR|nr:hypothetical protein F2Q69_00048134 [Brassica cretica]
MMLCGSLRDRIQPWLRDYVKLQSLAVILIYAQIEYSLGFATMLNSNLSPSSSSTLRSPLSLSLFKSVLIGSLSRVHRSETVIQIGCALIGSLGALYNGVLLINLVIALFALVAIESNSQSLGRTYAVLLLCALLLDISWFILFTQEIWSISAETYGTFFIFSVKLTMAMEMIGFFVRLSSSLLWFQIYRLGASIVETDSDLRNSFLNPPTPAIDRQRSGAEEILGGSIYDPAYYASLFEEAQSNLSSPNATQVTLVCQAYRFCCRFRVFVYGLSCSSSGCNALYWVWDDSSLPLALFPSMVDANKEQDRLVNHYSAENNGSPSAAEASQIKSSISRSLHAIDVRRERFEATAGDVFIMSKTPFKKGGAILANSKQTSVYFAVAEA